MVRYRVLVVDDEPLILSLLANVLEGAGYEVETAPTAAEGLQVFLARPHDCVILDKNLPDGDGISLLGQMRIADPEAQVLLLTGYPSVDSVVQALQLGAFDYLLKPLPDIEIVPAKVGRAIERRLMTKKNRMLVRHLTRANQELEEERERLRRSYLGTVEAMVGALEARDRYTVGHSERVAGYAARLASAIGLSDTDVERVAHASLLHDVGKIGICEGILNKPGALTEEEWDDMRRHPVIGCQLLAHGAMFTEILPGVRNHHERMDGAGYPDGLESETIPLLARIIAVADTYDAIISDRPYRRRAEPHDALHILEAVAGPQLDGTFVTAFAQLLRSGEIAPSYRRERTHLIHDASGPVRIAADLELEDAPEELLGASEGGA